MHQVRPSTSVHVFVSLQFAMSLSWCLCCRKYCTSLLIQNMHYFLCLHGNYFLFDCRRAQICLCLSHSLVHVYTAQRVHKEHIFLWSRVCNYETAPLLAPKFTNWKCKTSNSVTHERFKHFNLNLCAWFLPLLSLLKCECNEFVWVQLEVFQWIREFVCPACWKLMHPNYNTCTAVETVKFPCASACNINTNSLCQLNLTKL